MKTGELSTEEKHAIAQGLSTANATIWKSSFMKSYETTGVLTTRQWNSSARTEFRRKKQKEQSVTLPTSIGGQE